MASCFPAETPNGTDATALTPLSKVTFTSREGVDPELKISLALINFIFGIILLLIYFFNYVISVIYVISNPIRPVRSDHYGITVTAMIVIGVKKILVPPWIQRDVGHIW